MIRLAISLLFVLLLAPVPAARAQVISLRTCIEVGLTNNYSLRIARGEERIAENNATRANAGYLPTVEATAGYDAALNSSNVTARPSGDVTRQRGVADHGLRAGVQAEWTVFDGFRIQTTYKRLQELKRQSATQTRIVLEDYVAQLVAEYFNYVQQRIRMKNFRYAVSLSRERLRIVQERYVIGDNSRLDLLQAQVDFNADSAQALRQQQSLATSRIRLNQLMAVRDSVSRLTVADTTIDVCATLAYDSLWLATLRTNASLLSAAQDKRLADLDYRSVRARDYPYVTLSAGYGYNFDRYGSGASRQRSQWGGDVGVTVGFRLFDGQRQRERRNARINVENAELARQNLELSLHADLADLYQAYENNLRLLALERQNLVAAQENHFIAYERYLLGDLSGIEMREAQKNLLDAEERILVAEYDTKLCEISLLQLSGGIMNYLFQ